MILTSLTLQNFRSYPKKTFSFTDGVTLVIGSNTTGKTNMLEAVMLLATGKSFHAKRETEMLRWHKEMATVVGALEADADITVLEARITSGLVQGMKTPIKKYMVNGVARRQIDFIGNLRAVLFWPEDLELIIDSPSIRRRYLDDVLIQIDREYRRNLRSYERGIRQRNRLLDMIREGNASPHQLLFWNQLLVKTGNYLTDARQKFLDEVNGLQFGTTRYVAVYDKSVISDMRLEKYRLEEIAARSTLVGPHRDDFIVHEQHADAMVDLSRYGSRGEQRMAVLWLKFAELTYIEKKTGVRPVFLLDDIFSELDFAHRLLVLDIVKQQQTIITSADSVIQDELRSVLHEIIRL